MFIRKHIKVILECIKDHPEEWKRVNKRYDHDWYFINDDAEIKLTFDLNYHGHLIKVLINGQSSMVNWFEKRALNKAWKKWRTVLVTTKFEIKDKAKLDRELKKVMDDDLSTLPRPIVSSKPTHDE